MEADAAHEALVTAVASFVSLTRGAIARGDLYTEDHGRSFPLTPRDRRLLTECAARLLELMSDDVPRDEVRAIFGRWKPRRTMAEAESSAIDMGLVADMFEAIAVKSRGRRRASAFSLAERVRNAGEKLTDETIGGWLSTIHTAEDASDVAQVDYGDWTEMSDSERRAAMLALARRIKVSITL